MTALRCARACKSSHQWPLVITSSSGQGNANGFDNLSFRTWLTSPVNTSCRKRTTEPSTKKSICFIENVNEQTEKGEETRGVTDALLNCRKPIDNDVIARENFLVDYKINREGCTWLITRETQE